MISIIYFEYSGDEIKNPTLLYFGSITLLFGIAYFLMKIDLDKPINHSDIKDLPKKIEWINLKVNTEKIEFYSRSYYVEKPKSNNYRVQALDSTFNSSNSVIREKIENTHIRYKHYYKGKNRIFKSSNLSYDETTLRFLLSEKKQIDLYINRYDLKDYYFDLNFKD